MRFSLVAACCHMRHEKIQKDSQPSLYGSWKRLVPDCYTYYKEIVLSYHPSLRWEQCIGVKLPRVLAFSTERECATVKSTSVGYS